MIAIGSDHVGFRLKKEIERFLEQKEIVYKDIGTFSEERCDYTEFACKAAEQVARGICEKGILICGTGAGVSIAANKVAGIRCVCCSEPFTAEMSRRHNDTNMIAVGSRVVGVELAEKIVWQWRETPCEGGRHLNRVRQIAQIEQDQMRFV